MSHIGVCHNGSVVMTLTSVGTTENRTPGLNYQEAVPYSNVWRQNPLAGSHVFDWPFLVIKL